MLPATPDVMPAETPAVTKKSSKPRLTRVALLFVAVVAVFVGLGFAFKKTVEASILIGANAERGMATMEAFKGYDSCKIKTEECHEVLGGLAKRGTWMAYYLLQSIYRAEEWKKHPDILASKDTNRLKEIDFTKADNLLIEAIHYLPDPDLYMLLHVMKDRLSDETRAKALSSMTDKSEVMKWSLAIHSHTSLTREQHDFILSCYKKLDNRFKDQSDFVTYYIKPITRGECGKPATSVSQVTGDILWKDSMK